MTSIVSNSGPLITLASIGCLVLLHALYDEVIIPQAVYDEVVIKGAGEIGAQETAEADWVKVQKIEDRLAATFLREELGAGESEALVLAHEIHADLLLLDDLAARKKAQRIGLPVTGTLGVLLSAKSAGLIGEVKPLLDKLLDTDFRISPRVYQEVVARANE